MRAEPVAAGVLESALTEIATALAACGVDAGLYQRSGLLRRVTRRMRLLGILRIEVYAERLRRDADEARVLAGDLAQPQGLVFRDGELYAGLLRLLPGILEGRGRPQIWVPACGHGEDVYAIAMLAAQALETSKTQPDFLVYGTDVDPAILRAAAVGGISAAAAAYVPSALREKYLRAGDIEWTATPQLRQHTLFLRHSLTAPAPFFDVDLISCRNLLEPLDPGVQRRVLERLHAALRPGGLLAAGVSKSLPLHADLFMPLRATPGLLLRVDSAKPVLPPEQTAGSIRGKLEGVYRQAFESSRFSSLVLNRAGEILAANAAAIARFPQALAVNATAPLSSIATVAATASVLKTLNRPGVEGQEITITLLDDQSARLHLQRLPDVDLMRVEFLEGVADENLRRDHTRLHSQTQTTLDALAEGVVQLDVRGNVLEFNAAAERLTGWSRAEALSQPYGRVFRLQGAKGNLQDHPIDSALGGSPPTGDRNDLYLLHRDGRRAALRLRLRTVPGGGLVIVFDDVGEMNLLTEELAYRASHDPLTGLLNREEFESRARAAVSEARNSGRTSVLCYIDVDQFKVINDTLGHIAGDELLHELAGELRSQVAENDAFARLGGDEFGVLLLGQDLQSARGAVDALVETARRFRFNWQNQTYAVTISVGAALIDEAAHDVTRPMSMADAACFVAKDAGRDRVRFAGEDDELARRHVQMSLIGKIGKSLDENRFVLHYEDVVSVDAPKQVVYRELLLRMLDEDGKLLTPAAFIQAAERYFLMGAIDRWVLRNAFRGIAALPEDGIIYAVNLSGQSLGDDKFLDFVLTELDNSGVDPVRICFEITETAAVSRLSEAVRFVSRISDFGVRFALDDFGSGMASFSYLKNFPVDFLKIDGSFVRAMLGSRADRGMVETINRIGHEMGLKTIAEHVESTALLAPLREMGVDWVQGRAISWSQPFDLLLR